MTLTKKPKISYTRKQKEISLRILRLKAKKNGYRDKINDIDIEISFYINELEEKGVDYHKIVATNGIPTVVTKQLKKSKRITQMTKAELVLGL